MSIAKFWQDEDAVDKVSNTIRELVDSTAKAAVEEFITNEELCVMFSREDTTVYVSSIGDHDQSAFSRHSILNMLNDVIKRMEEDGDDPLDSPYHAMRDAFLKWAYESGHEVVGNNIVPVLAE